MKLTLRLTLLALLLPAGCRSASFDVSIDSRSRAFSPASYLLIPADPDKDPESLEFAEFSSYAAAVLEERGLRRVLDPAAATLVVGFDYGVDDGERISYSSSMPVFGERIWSQTPGYLDPNLNYGNRRPLTTWGVVGYRHEQHEDTEYERSCTLIAWPADGVQKSDGFSESPPELWHTQISSRGGKSDLRAVLPAMLWAAREHVGTDTQQRIQVQVPVQSPEVDAWRSAALAATSRASSSF